MKQSNNITSKKSKINLKAFKSRIKNLYYLIALLVVLIIVLSIVLYRENHSQVSAGPPKPPINLVNIPNVVVEISANEFTPTVSTIEVNQAIVWSNGDKAAHEIAFSAYNGDISFPNPNIKVTLNPKDTYRLIFLKAGSFYYSDPHDSKLKGEIVVQP